MKKDQSTAEHVTVATKVKGLLNGRCLHQNIIYNKLIRYNQPHTQDKVCFGIVETYFKSYANHLQSFNDRYEEKDTESLNEFWLKASIGFFWK